jgi:hypothetical protein
MSTMSRQPGSRRSGGGGGNGGVARGASFAAAKGAGLIGLAVIVGIVLLNVVDDGSTGPAGSDRPSATTTPGATTDDGGTDATTTTAAAAPARTPEQLRVVVLNGGAPTGSARAMSDALKQQGYTNQAEPADWSGRDQTGASVHCREGLQQEASALAVQVSESSVPVEAFPDPAPPGTDDIDCIVVVGATA